MGSETLVAPGLDVLWGKSSAGGRVNLLVQHLFDAAAVAELLWDEFLPAAVRRPWDLATGGRGRDVLRLACGLHDVGKASPAFQGKVEELAVPVRAAGLVWPRLKPAEERWHHTVAGAARVRDLLARRGVGREGEWWWPLIAGHHGRVPDYGTLRPPSRVAHGPGPVWQQAVDGVIEAVEAGLGVSLTDVASWRPASRSHQLALLGWVVMADWIASSDHFPGIDDWGQVSIGAGRSRAARAWAQLGVRPGWSGRRLLLAGADVVAERFETTARPSQSMVIEAAEWLPAPGLVVVEAPMGEGKTEAALAAVEVLSRRFGHAGVFVGMPTQATSDPMFVRVQKWSASVDPAAALALLHGKARFNPAWRELRERPVAFSGVDQYGCDDDFGVDAHPAAAQSGGVGPSQAPAEWFLGPKRGLLTPIVVGTVDQLLLAATRTKHVMLRHAGLVGKVVVLDEVHAYDVFMSQFVGEAFRWLAEAGVPVVVLSATLPPALRDELVRAYLQGVTGQRDVDAAAAVRATDAEAGYPGVLAVTATARELPVAGTAGSAATVAASNAQDAPDETDDGAGVVRVLRRAAPSWRPGYPVRVEVVPEPDDDPDAVVVALLSDRLAAGGCALVVRNTVSRAQQTYQALDAAGFDEDVVLLHARLRSGERADRSRRVLEALAAPGPDRCRPGRFVVVATQLAEQSFDVDVDVLVTDVAPVDLLLQRVGRLHRHARAADARPAGLRVPTVVVTGFRGDTGAPPWFPRALTRVYPEPLLMRAAAAVLEAAGDGRGWVVPDDVPDLVEAAYRDDPVLPAAWLARHQTVTAGWQQTEAERRAKAREFLLAGEDRIGEPTLAGLHARSRQVVDETEADVMVRDGDRSVEVVLVRRDATGWRTLAGLSLGVNGDGVTAAEVLEAVLRDAVRLPASLTDAALTDLAPLPGWLGDPWLGRTPALPLEQDSDGRLTTTVGDWQVGYDEQLGLLSRRKGQH